MRPLQYAAILAIALSATPAWAIVPPSNVINNVDVNTKQTIDPAIEPAVPQKISDSAVKPINADLGKIVAPSDSGSATYKPLPFNPPIISPDLLKGPTITDIKLALGQDRLKISWSTNKLATGKVVYGTTDQYGTTLENATMATSHELIVPTQAGELHLKISSTDAAKKESNTPDMLVQIPSYEAPPTAPDASTTTQIQQNPNEPGKTVTSTPEPSNDKTAVADKNDGAEKTQPTTSSSITATDAVLGGAAVLLLGVLVGVFLPRKKKTE